MHSIREYEEDVAHHHARAKHLEGVIMVKSSMARYLEASMEGRRRMRWSMANGEIINSASASFNLPRNFTSLIKLTSSASPWT